MSHDGAKTWSHTYVSTLVHGHIHTHAQNTQFCLRSVFTVTHRSTSVEDSLGDFELLTLASLPDCFL